MNSTEHNHEEKSPVSPVERDVLGLEKNPGIANSPKAKPNRIFIVLAIVAVIALAYWFITK